MHEATLCAEITEIALKAAEEHGMSIVDEIIISAGPHSCINEASLNFYFTMLRENTCLENTYITVECDETLTGISQMYVKSIKGE